MAKSKENKTDDSGQVHLSSSEVEAQNEHVARTPAGPDSPQGGPVLTGHTTKAGVVEDADGNVQAFHQTTVVTDPESPDAVILAPGTAADGRGANALGVHGEPSPNDVAAGAKPVSESVEDSDRKPISDAS